MDQIRINKFLSDSGVCSRRSADKLIELGAVRVGKNIVDKLGTKIDPEKDQVFVNGRLIEKKEESVYYILNKPVGYVTTSHDPHGRKKVTDLLPKNPRIYPVGRLDYASSGLIILTNDGDFSYRMSHPKFEKEKEYLVVAKIINQDLKIKDLVSSFRSGVNLKEGIARADKIKILSQNGKKVEFSIVIHQGWNRQIRRMCEKIGMEVVSLKRVRMGEVRLGKLKEGEWKKIKKEDIR